MTLTQEEVVRALGDRREAERIAAAVVAHHAELVRWNRTHNLTRVPEGGALERHYLDAVRGFGLLEGWYGEQERRLPGRVVDVGSGAGFPGFVGALLWPDTAFTLLDASVKRCSFLRHVLGLTGVRAAVLHARAEEVAEQWPLVVSRATVQPESVKRLLGLAAVGGHCALWVGGRAEVGGAAVLERGGTRVAIVGST